jgi:hypothetical protein
MGEGLGIPDYCGDTCPDSCWENGNCPFQKKADDFIDELINNQGDDD